MRSHSRVRCAAGESEGSAEFKLISCACYTRLCFLKGRANKMERHDNIDNGTVGCEFYFREAMLMIATKQKGRVKFVTTAPPTHFRSGK